MYMATDEANDDGGGKAGKRRLSALVTWQSDHLVSGILRGTAYLIAMSADAGPSTLQAPLGTTGLEQELADTKLEESGGETTAGESTRKYARGENPKLRYKKPYWWAYKTFVKQRYVNQESKRSDGQVDR
jgi:hypothetical protein